MDAHENSSVLHGPCVSDPPLGKGHRRSAMEGTVPYEYRGSGRTWRDEESPKDNHLAVFAVRFFHQDTVMFLIICPLIKFLTHLPMFIRYLDELHADPRLLLQVTLRTTTG